MSDKVKVEVTEIPISPALAGLLDSLLGGPTPIEDLGITSAYNHKTGESAVQLDINNGDIVGILDPAKAMNLGRRLIAAAVEAETAAAVVAELKEDGYVADAIRHLLKRTARRLAAMRGDAKMQAAE